MMGRNAGRMILPAPTVTSGCYEIGEGGVVNGR